MKRIIVGYDGSAHAKKGLERAAALARMNGANVAVVGVSRLAASGHGPSVEDSREHEDRERELPEAVRYLGERSISATMVHGHGDPADVLVEEASRSQADLIVVGTHGRGLPGRMLLGSVSTKVVQHAPCDVLVVR